MFSNFDHRVLPHILHQYLDEDLAYLLTILLFVEMVEYPGNALLGVVPGDAVSRLHEVLGKAERDAILLHDVILLQYPQLLVRGESVVALVLGILLLRLFEKLLHDVAKGLLTGNHTLL